MYHLMLLHLDFQLNFQVYSCNHISSLLLVINFLKDDYPANPPEFKLLNKIYHPNIHSTGCICPDCVGTRTWTGYIFNSLMDLEKWTTSYWIDKRQNKLIDLIKLVIGIVNKPLKVK